MRVGFGWVDGLSLTRPPASLDIAFGADMLSLKEYGGGASRACDTCGVVKMVV